VNQIIIHHNDLDGRAAAACVAMFAAAPVAGDQIDRQFIECDYQSVPCPNGDRWRDADVWILDYSLPADTLAELLTLTDRVTWIDHHVTALADAPNGTPGHKLRGDRRVGVSACVLTWLYLHKRTAGGRGPEMAGALPLRTVPEALLRINAWDLAGPGCQAHAHCFAAGLESLPHGPEALIWRELLGPIGTEAERVRGLENLTRDGVAILRSRTARNTDYARQYAFGTELDGLRAMALNSSAGADAFGDHAHGAAELEIVFRHTGRVWEVSLYRGPAGVDELDVSQIAKRYGGGGHAGAAGFCCAMMPFAPYSTATDLAPTFDYPDEGELTAEPDAD